MKPRKMRLFSLLLCLALVLCTLPFAVMAADSNYPLLQENYQKDTIIWYTESADEKPVDHRHIQTVTLGGKTVNYASSGLPADNGVALNTIYPDVTSETDAGTATLTITPKSGYYVTKVVIACCHQGGSAFKCQTWNHDSAFEKEFDMSTGMNVSINVTSNNFGHTSKEN